MNFEDIGPIQLLVVGFGDDADFSGEIMEELELLVEAGFIRVIDLQFVTKDDDGEVYTAEATSLDVEEAAEFGSVIGALIGMGAAGQEGAEAGAVLGAEAAIENYFGLGATDIAGFADELAPGESIGMVLFEHVWATYLKSAIRNSGGVPIAQGFLTPEALLMVGAELDAIVRAEETIELSAVIQAEAMVEALVAVETAETIKAVAAAEAIDALVTAGIIEDVAMQRALEAVYEAGVIEEAAFAAAQQAALAAQAEMPEDSDA